MRLRVPGPHEQGAQSSSLAEENVGLKPVADEDGLGGVELEGAVDDVEEGLMRLADDERFEVLAGVEEDAGDGSFACVCDGA